MSDNTVFCRECNAPNQANSKFCSNCGSSLKPATHITCPNCFHRNSLQVLYCDNCGTRLVRESTLSNEENDDDTLSVNVPTGFSLPSRNPGDTADLDPDSLPDWLKTGGSEGEADDLDDDWLTDLAGADKSSQGDSFFELDDSVSVNLDWMQAGDENKDTADDDWEKELLFSEEPADSDPIGFESEPETPSTPTETIDVGELLARDEPDNTGDFDWLSVMGDVDLEEPAGESPRTGFTGLLNPDILNAFEEAEEADDAQPANISELADWLADETAMDQDSSDEWLRDTSTGFTDDLLLAEGEEEPLQETERTGFTNWLEANPIDAAEEDELEETAAPAASLEDEIPDWLSPPETVADTPSNASQPEASEDLPDWFDTPETGSLESSQLTNTGFTGWLNAQDVDDFEAQQTAPSSAEKEEELPDWLDTPTDTAAAADSQSIGTGFTGWLDSSTVDSYEASSDNDFSESEPELFTADEPAEEDVPDWLQNPPDEADEEEGTGFTDWLQDADDEDDDSFFDDDEEQDDDDFDWMDEETTQELMRPLTTEEAEKMLENTPDVTDEFIQEVVEGDFPEWLTDVKTVEDIDETGLLPSWISAPVSESDTLTLGLGRDLPTSAEDATDWLASLENEGNQAQDNDWFDELGTFTAAAGDFDDFKPLDEEEFADDEDFSDFVSEITADEPADQFGSDDFDAVDGNDWLSELSDTTPADEPAAPADDLPDWLSGPATTEEPSSSASDDWLTEMSGGDNGESASDGNDWLSDLPSLDEAPSASGGDDWLSDLSGVDSGTSTAGGDDWLSDMPSADSSSSFDSGDDWLADMPSSNDDHLPADDSLFDLPSFDAPADDFSGSTTPLSDDWLADMPDEGGDDIGQTWMEGLGSLNEGDSATDSLDWLNQPFRQEEPEEPEVEAPPLEIIEEPEEPRDPTLLDPVLDFENFNLGTTGGDEGDLDWLSMIETTDDLDADAVSEKADSTSEEDNESWLMGADLEESTQDNTIADDLRAVVFKEEAQPNVSSASFDTFGDDWESDLMTPLGDEDSEDILQELRAMRMTDRLDPAVVEAVRQDDDDPEISDFITESKPVTGSLAEADTDSNVVPPLWGDTTTDEFDDDWGIGSLEREKTVQVGGPLSGLRGVVNIAPAVAAAPPTAALPANGRVKIEESHEQQALLLKQIAHTGWVANSMLAAESAADSQTSGRSLNITQIVIGLLLIASILTGLLLPNLLPTTTPPASPEISQLNQTLSSLNNQKILVAFEYPPALAGELNPQATLLLNELAAGGNEIIVMSQYPTGLDNAQPVYTAVEGLTTTSIGYIPGEALGLRELANCLNQSSCQVASGQTLSLDTVAGIIVLTGERDNLINWVEQIEPQTEVPLVLGVTEALSPLAQPYLVSNQLDGLLGGLSAAAAYENSYQTTTDLAHLLQAQTMAKLAVIIVILVGAVMAAIPTRSTQTETSIEE